MYNNFKKCDPFYPAAGCPRHMHPTGLTLPLLGSTGGLIQLFADVISHKVLPTNEMIVVYDESLGESSDVVRSVLLVSWNKQSKELIKIVPYHLIS